MKKKILITSAILLTICLIAFTFWFRTLNVKEAYVVSTGENLDGAKHVWVVELAPEETASKTQAEIIQLINEKTAEPSGVFLHNPWPNRLLSTDFQKGDKITAYWHGLVMQSNPAQIPGTVLIVKTGDG